VAVQRQQQPAAQLLREGMVAVAGGGLAHVGRQRLGVTQQLQSQWPASLKKLLQHMAVQPIPMARRVHSGRAGGCVAAHEKRNAHHALIAHAGTFCRSTRYGHIVQRNNGSGGKAGML
jgi:hypothetical protein